MRHKSVEALVLLSVHGRLRNLLRVADDALFAEQKVDRKDHGERAVHEPDHQIHGKVDDPLAEFNGGAGNRTDVVHNPS